MDIGVSNGTGRSLPQHYTTYHPARRIPGGPADPTDHRSVPGAGVKTFSRSENALTRPRKGFQRSY